MLYKISFLAMPFILTMVLMGCSSKLHFLICPSEYSSKMKAEQDSWKQRELLFGSDYRIVMVKQDASGKITPVQHYYPQSDDVSIENPEYVSFEKPYTVSTIITINKPNQQIGIAIKKKQDKSWRVYWAAEKELSVGAVPKTFGVIYLPPYDTLPKIQ